MIHLWNIYFVFVLHNAHLLRSLWYFIVKLFNAAFVVTLTNFAQNKPNGWLGNPVPHLRLNLLQICIGWFSCYFLFGYNCKWEMGLSATFLTFPSLRYWSASAEHEHVQDNENLSIWRVYFGAPDEWVSFGCWLSSLSLQTCCECWSEVCFKFTLLWIKFGVFSLNWSLIVSPPLNSHWAI